MQKLKHRARKWSAGWLSIYLDWRLKKKRSWRMPDIILVDMVVKVFIKKPVRAKFSDTLIDEYRRSLSNTQYWHGTGRRQYVKGKDTDVFTTMLKDESIKPFKDIFDYKKGEMHSISVAQQRMYGRIYGDMHSYKGVNLSSRYGSPRFWAYYFIVATALHAIKEFKLWNKEARAKQEKEVREKGTKYWCTKVHRNPSKSWGEFFNEGSDIKDNYPILIGLMQSEYKRIETADYITRYEVRVSQPIAISNFSHIEVPAKQMARTKKILAKHGLSNLPVYPLELAEQEASSKRFSSLVS